MKIARAERVRFVVRRPLRTMLVAVTVLLPPPLRAETAPLSTVLPGVGAHDPRVPVDATALPWRALARLQIPGVGRCTAVLVAPQVALTAAHCVFSERLGRVVPPGSIHLLTGYASGGFAHHAVATGVRLAPGYDPARPEASRGVDAAVLDLAAPLVEPRDAIGLAAGMADAGTQVTLAGFSQDRAEVILADRGCAVTGLGRDAGGHVVLVHGCTGSRGTSGGPLLAIAADGRPSIVGLQEAAYDGRPGGVAVPVPVLAALLASR